MLAMEKAGLSYIRCDKVPFNFTSKGLEVAVFTTYHVIILPYEIADRPGQWSWSDHASYCWFFRLKDVSVYTDQVSKELLGKSSDFDVHYTLRWHWRTMFILNV